MQPVMNPKHPGLSVRVVDDGFAAYIWGSDFSFEVSDYATAQIGRPVGQWPVTPIVPYRKCYGIDPEEFSSFRDAPDSEIFMAYLDDQPVGHLVVSTNWNGYAHIDELAVHAPARRHGVAKALLDVAQFWSRKKNCRASCSRPRTTIWVRAGSMSVAVTCLAVSITCAIAALTGIPLKWRCSGTGCSTIRWACRSVAQQRLGLFRNPFQQRLEGG